MYKKIFLSFVFSVFLLLTTSFAQSSNLNICPTLKYPQTVGSRDSKNFGETTRLQSFLKQNLNLNDNQFLVTGYFGNITKNFVKQFQSQNNLIPTGIIGAVTRVKIANSCGGSGQIERGGITIPSTINCANPPSGCSYIGGTKDFCGTLVCNTTNSCNFNGQTVPDRSNVIAYKSLTALDGETCQSETRTCNNGVLSGSFTNSTCKQFFPASISLSKPSVAVNHFQIMATGASGKIIDAPLATFLNGGTRYWLNSNPVTNSVYTGSLDNPFENLAFQKTNADFFTNPDKNGGNYWVVNTYQDTAGLLAFVHVEFPFFDNGQYITGKGRIGLAWSTNNGNNFTYIGDILIPSGDPKVINLEGAPYIIKDGYFYVYYDDSCEEGVKTAVVRAPVAEVINAAKNGKVTTWSKYYNGNWTSDSMGGKCSAINIENGISHTNAAYSTYTGKYYMLQTYENWLGSNTWIRLYESSDGINWIMKKTIVEEPASSVVEGYQYANILDTSGNGNGVVDKNFYIYSAKDPFSTSVVYRWLVDLSGAQLPITPEVHRFSNEVSRIQGINNWYYQNQNDSVLSNMTWDKDQYGGSWQGNENYLFVTPDGSMAPGDKGNAVLKWVAPKDGSLQISGNAHEKPGACGDGVSASILQNDTKLWNSNIDAGDSVGKSYNINSAVKKNDVLYFVISKGGASNTNWCDTTVWDPMITYP